MNSPEKINIDVLFSLLYSGQLAELELICKQLLDVQPHSPVVLNLLGLALKEKNQLQKALSVFDQAIQLESNYADAYHNRGLVFFELGYQTEAFQDLYKSIQLKPEQAHFYNNIGIVLQNFSLLDDALSSYITAVSLEPKNRYFWASFSDCVRGITFTAYDENIAAYLLQMYEQITVHPKDISRAVISMLSHHPDISNALKLSESNHLVKNIHSIAIALSKIPLLIRTMELGPIADAKMENIFTQMRKSMLMEVINNQIPESVLPFYSTLSIHCSINEYIYFESDEEKQELKKLINEIEIDLEHSTDLSPSLFIILGTYRLLNSFSWADQLLEHNWSDDINRVISEQIKDIKLDLRLSSQIIPLTPINTQNSETIRQQYEENPYPRWVKTDIYDKPRTIQASLHLSKLSIPIKIQSLSSSPDILIAGCGTGQNAINTASRFLKCHVLAIDLSLNSLSYAIRKTQALGITNIEYRQGDILELNQLKTQFDIIESVGVLHHLNDSFSGFKILADKVKTNGLMKIGLYSETARQALSEAQQFVTEHQYTATAENIRQCRNDFFKMAIDSNLKMTEIIEYNDFYSLSECRDLLFPALEHRFTLLQIEQMLNELNLTFIGFEFSNNIIRKQFLEVFPYDNALLSLPLWHRFELNNPEAFGGMYQFWVQKK